MSPVHAALSANTQAILLLTAPLIAGHQTRSNDLLSAGEYRRLARHLREQQRQPADLLVPEAGELINDCRLVVDAERMKRLLARSFLLSQAVERWRTRAIWVVSRADAAYPHRIKARLKDDAPAIIYGCGDGDLLDAGGLAVVGSRNVDDILVRYTEGIGRMAAKARRMLISGGARGIDQAAMRGAVEAGGSVAGVLADSLERTALNREHRNLLMDGQLVLISPYDPGAGFNVGNAMQRNKLIYALADAALVVSADWNKGGTWAGAVEQLEKLRLVPIYIRSSGAISRGLDALRNLGAMDWPNPDDAGGLEAALRAAVSPYAIPQTQDLLALSVREPEPPPHAPAEQAVPLVAASAGEAFAAVREVLLQLLTMPRREAEVAAALHVSAVQAKKWLQQLVAEGVVEKRKKPVSYVLPQVDLFNRSPSAVAEQMESDA